MRQEHVKIKGEAYLLVSDYKDKQELREGFFKLALQTFKIDFKPWYEAGYWSDTYRPYSIVHEGKVVANVSISTADFMLEGEVKHWFQIGTVMTDEAYRGKGLSRYLIEHVMQKYGTSGEVVYLFANDKVLNFYPKFGFIWAEEVEYSKKLTHADKVLDVQEEKSIETNGAQQTVQKEESDSQIRQLKHTEVADKDLVLDKSRQSYKYARLAAHHNTNLIMFYWGDFLQDRLYYIESLDTIVAMTYENETLRIEDIFGEAPLEEVVDALIKEETKEVILGFTPKDAEGYTPKLLHEDDTTLFINNREIKEQFSQQKLRFPSLSHT